MIPTNFIRAAFNFACATLLILILSSSSAKAEKTIVNLSARDLVYSPLDNQIYASVPNSSTTNPNSLTPINPANGNLGSPVAIGFDPAELVISSDGTQIHTIIGGRIGVQQMSVPSQTKGSLFALTGGPQVKQIHAVPGRAGAVLLATHMPGFSPPATGTIIVENGVRLTDRVGTGLGVGGPDIVTVDPTDGTSAYGYQNSLTSFGHWVMEIDGDGIHGLVGPTLNGVMTGFDVNNIALLGNRLFNNRGEVFSISPALQVGSFMGGGNFVIDIENDRLFSLTDSGTTHTLREYSLSTHAFLNQEDITGVSGTTSDLIRFGSNGFAFTTSDNQVVLFNSSLLPAPVPEPSSIAFASMSLLGLALFAWRKKRQG